MKKKYKYKYKKESFLKKRKRKHIGVGWTTPYWPIGCDQTTPSSFLYFSFYILYSLILWDTCYFIIGADMMGYQFRSKFQTEVESNDLFAIYAYHVDF